MRSSLFRDTPVVLPPPREESWNWQLQARCRDHDPTTFFGTDDSEPAAAETEANAKAVCAHCPVRELCLAYALEAQEQFGVWGGLTERERRQYKWFNFGASVAH